MWREVTCVRTLQGATLVVLGLDISVALTKDRNEEKKFTSWREFKTEWQKHDWYYCNPTADSSVEAQRYNYLSDVVHDVYVKPAELTPDAKGIRGL